MANTSGASKATIRLASRQWNHLRKSETELYHDLAVQLQRLTLVAMDNFFRADKDQRPQVVSRLKHQAQGFYVGFEEQDSTQTWATNCGSLCWDGEDCVECSSLQFKRKGGKAKRAPGKKGLR